MVLTFEFVDEMPKCNILINESSLVILSYGTIGFSIFFLQIKILILGSERQSCRRELTGDPSLSFATCILLVRS